ncbi:uncharacterized protein STEHIDRAFT_150828 [Stereum hirsutum FP-91666 SS1]|uniref:Uncharacterized protein n=1 Tax=Stereum hirsutum (strain FP-91666) TaxID=721885 RepID=R7RYG0_STEHR|nr:uncharacterized protein STEHIDRAFT_150828 [Stereum hirsutum FP-91666 SS1]EIM79940.1 hypothetical protein STEHIDRAFT_150828 [Stereum hirsutum FP-91666 SS1]
MSLLFSHFTALDERIQLHYQGSSRFVILSKVTDDAWIVHLGLAREGRWWKGSWEEGDILEIAGKRILPKNLEALADNLATKLIDDDLEVENWDPLVARGDKAMKLTLGPSGKKPLRINLVEMSANDAAIFAVGEFISIALQAQSRQCHINPSNYDGALSLSNKKHRRSQSIDQDRATSPIETPSSPGPSTQGTQEASQRLDRKRSNATFRIPTERSTQTAGSSKSQDKPKGRGKAKEKEKSAPTPPLAVQPSAAELAALEEVRQLKEELKRQKSLVASASLARVGSNAGLMSRSVIPAQPRRKGASLANPNKKARKLEELEFASDSD